MRRRIALALAASALVTPVTAEAAEGCNSEVCEQRVAERRAGEQRAARKACRSKSCRRRTCRSSACRERVAARALARAPHRPALASWYGPGLYGRTTACGQTLTPGLYGVAHKGYACGTRVRVCARRCLTVHVVDRGPYVGGREFDLTAATARAVGFGGVGTIRVRVG